MKLDELVTVWRTQDAAPLHDVNKTLLHLALREDDAKLQRARRRDRWMIYLFSAGLLAGMAIFLSMLIHFLLYRTGKGVNGWDLALPLLGATAAVIAMRATYLNHRGQLRREQAFGESLRDQLHRRIAQLDDQATSSRRTLILVVALMGGVGPAAILLLTWRVNDKPISDDGYLLITQLIICVWCVVTGIRQQRHLVQTDILPRKHRLEALLKELDGQ